MEKKLRKNNSFCVFKKFWPWKGPIVFCSNYRLAKIFAKLVGLVFFWHIAAECRRPNFSFCDLEYPGLQRLILTSWLGKSEPEGEADGDGDDGGGGGGVLDADAPEKLFSGGLGSRDCWVSNRSFSSMRIMSDFTIWHRFTASWRDRLKSLIWSSKVRSPTSIRSEITSNSSIRSSSRA